MANLSGIFSSPYAGRLTCTFTGTFYIGSRVDPGFNTSPGSAPSSSLPDMTMRAVINGTPTTMISRMVNSGVVELDYPGGNVAWVISSEIVDHVTFGNFGIQNLKLVCSLRKK